MTFLRTAAAATAALTLALPLAFSGPAIAKSGAKPGTKGAVVVIDYGIYTLNVTRTVKAPGDISLERNVVSNIKLMRRARQIMAQPGRSFGFRFRVTDPALIGKRLTLRTIFPKMTNPANGKSATHNDRPFVANSPTTVHYDGYRFDYRWEMAEGIWKFQLLDGNRVVAEQTFKIIVPLN